MSLGYVSVAAATAALGYDLARDTTWQQSRVTRELVGIALKGSAAALDTKVDVFIGSTKVGEIFNSGTGAPNRDDMFRIGARVPASEEVHLIVSDAPATNPINAIVDFADLM